MDLKKPEATGSTDEQVRRLIDAATTLTVNVGGPGNIKKVVLQGDRRTVADALAAAGMSANGYEVRVAGETVSLDRPLQDGQTVLLLRPVRGNLDLAKPAEGAGEGARSITVNVGGPGNIKKVTLTGDQRWKVADALRAAGLNAKGYEIRVSGETVTTDVDVNDGQTVLLLRPVRGN